MSEVGSRAEQVEPGSYFENVLCVPVESLLTALNVTAVDVFVLDVEMSEMEILKNFPFHRIKVDVWIVEHTKEKGGKHMNEDPKLVDFMEESGYYLYDTSCYWIPDYVFVRRASNVFQKLGVPTGSLRNRGICQRKAAQGVPFIHANREEKGALVRWEVVNITM